MNYSQEELAQQTLLKGLAAVAPDMFGRSAPYNRWAALKVHSLIQEAEIVAILCRSQEELVKDKIFDVETDTRPRRITRDGKIYALELVAKGPVLTENMLFDPDGEINAAEA